MKVALAGNPNVGKSTLFNALTGLRQHTGNWPGKTVGKVVGETIYRGQRIELIDLPGTYSLTGNSEDERIAAEYIASGEADCIIAVCDGSALERSLILALQILRRTNRVVLCVNLMDEAKRRGMCVDAGKLEQALGVPVVLVSAGKRKGLEELMERIVSVESADVVSIDDPFFRSKYLLLPEVKFFSWNMSFVRLMPDSVQVINRNPRSFSQPFCKRGLSRSGATNNDYFFHNVTSKVLSITK
jgi:small GTP-binding protein